MRFDSHAHAWRTWPYERPAPAGPGGIAGLVEVLVEADVCGALVVCADLPHSDPSRDNRDNNAWVHGETGGDRNLIPAPSVDSFWSETYHRPGAAGRLGAAVDTWGSRVVTHYLGAHDDGWFDGPDGVDFLSAAERAGIVLSLHAPSSWQSSLGRAAQRHPGLRLLIHHLGRPALVPENHLATLLGNAAHPNIWIKVSGSYYVDDLRGAGAALGVFEQLYSAYGGGRLVWGSDYPASVGRLTYQESIAFVESATFVRPVDRARIMGQNLVGLLGLEECG